MLGIHARGREASESKAAHQRGSIVAEAVGVEENAAAPGRKVALFATQAEPAIVLSHAVGVPEEAVPVD